MRRPPCPALDPRAIIALPRVDRGADTAPLLAGHAGVHEDGNGPARVGEMVRRSRPRPVDGRHRGGGHAARARRLAGLALRGRPAGAARRAGRARPRRDARAGARARHRPARDRRARRSPSCAHCAPGSPRPSAALGLRAAVAGTHPLVARRGGRGLPRRPLPVPALSRCASSPGASRRSRCTCTSPCPTPSSPSAPTTACARTYPCCSRSPRTRRSPAGATAGSPRARTPVFQAFPRTGIPREFESYADYVEAIDVLLRCGAIPEPTFIWWDVRLQPKLGTLEVRVMDAQTRIRDTAALAALVQCLVRCEALGGHRRAGALARARGAGREPLPGRARRHRARSCSTRTATAACPASGRLATLVDACWPHARALGCERELALLAHLAGDPGAVRQRAIASEPEGLAGLLHTLQAEFSPPRPQLAAAAWRAPRAAPVFDFSDRSTRSRSSFDTRGPWSGGPPSLQTLVWEKGCCTPGFWTLLPRSPAFGGGPPRPGLDNLAGSSASLVTCLGQSQARRSPRGGHCPGCGRR